MAIVVYRSSSKRKILNDTLLDKTKVLDHRNEELKGLNELKNKLFSVLAHDLRSPIASLTGLLDLLDDSSINEKKRAQILGKLKLQLQNTEQLLTSIVTWSRSQVQGIQLKVEKIDVKEILQTELELARVVAEEKCIELKMAHIEATEVKSDQSIVRLIIRNLLSNALKFTPKGGSVELGCDCSQPDSFNFWVKDSGIGMDAAQLEHLFSPRIKNTTGTNKEMGFGLGLMLCNDFAQKLNAKINVESKVGSGSVFTVTVPSS